MWVRRILLLDVVYFLFVVVVVVFIIAFDAVCRSSCCVCLYSATDFQDYTSGFAGPAMRA